MKENIRIDTKTLEKTISDLASSTVLLPAHILLTLYFFVQNEHGGKYNLSKFLGNSPSRARKLLSVLEKHDLIQSHPGRKGSFLTANGEKLASQLFNYIKVINSDSQSINLGNLTMGPINYIIAVPLKLIFNINDQKKQINVIEIRDSAIKIGAIGASIFQSRISTNNGLLNIGFFNPGSSESSIEEMNMQQDFEILKSKIYPFLSNQMEWIIIACSSDKLSKFYFNPLFNVSRVDPIKICQLSAFQSLYENLLT